MRNGSLLLSHDAWFVRLYVGGKQRAYRLGPKRQFMTKKEVRAAADRKMLELRMVDAGSAGRITLETFIRLWYLSSSPNGSDLPRWTSTKECSIATSPVATRRSDR